MTRWIAAHVIGGVIGAWSGALVLTLLFLSAASILQFQDCSGIPCGEGVFSSFLISVVVGSVVGGMVGHVTTQGILQRTFTKRDLLRYALIGVVLAPIVGVLSSVVLIVLFPLIDALEAIAPPALRLRSRSFCGVLPATSCRVWCFPRFNGRSIS